MLEIQFREILSSFYFGHVAPEITRSLPVIEMMNWLKYDALTLGNNDFELLTKILKTEHSTSVIQLAVRKYQLL